MKLLIFCLTILLFLNCGNIPGNKELRKENASSDTTLIFKLKEVATGLYGPVALENAHDGSGRIFVGEQAGKIRVIKNGQLLKEPFLDIRSLLVNMKNRRCQHSQRYRAMDEMTRKREYALETFFNDIIICET